MKTAREIDQVAHARIAEEARAELVPERMGAETDWARVEAAIEQRVADGARAQALAVAEETPRSRSRWTWGGVATALGGVAIAAAIALTLGRAPDTAAPIDAERAVSDGRASPGGTFVGRAGDAAIVRGAALAGGTRVVVGDVVEAIGAPALFEDADAVAWGIEDGTRVVVSRTGAPLVLTLERGAVEAQVAPVARGEAFAVDVDGLRVAVHGTHLRVARDGVHVAIDLSEGVVAIGAPPRGAGTTEGKIVTAPAHVDVDARDPSAITVTHGLAALRSPDARVALGALRRTASASASASEPATDRGAAPANAVGDVNERAPAIATDRGNASAGASAGNASAGAGNASANANAGAKTALAAPPAPPAGAHAAAAGDAPSVAPFDSDGDPRAAEAIADAVRACAERQRHAGPAGATGADLVVIETSTLELGVGASGDVLSARFVPPLPPALQACAAPAIYRARFPKARAGAVRVPIVLER